MGQETIATPEPILASAIAAVARGADGDATLADLLRLATEASGADSAAAFLWDSERAGLALAGSVGIPADDVPAYETAVAASEHPVARTSVERIPAVAEAPAGPGQAKFTAAWPLVVRRDGTEEPIGTLALGRAAPWMPSEAAASRLAAIADLVAIAVDRERLASLVDERADWLERVANSDSLTGLANARTAIQVLQLEIARAGRLGIEICVGLFDVDGLTAINAEVGNEAGDHVLREVAAVLTESVRFVDTVARWGGDEFLLIAPGATGDTVARRIVDAVAARPAVAGRAFSVSAGLARFPRDDRTSEALVAKAKAALHAAQAVGPGTVAEATA
ncbi:MAG TPA: GGDEF domain-containing protein [Candidatus Eisenbacteria bacterium]|nr:GGDEF domain-containing protein [Candidatus Eisenbacteria bacterium]